MLVNVLRSFVLGAMRLNIIGEDIATE
jgi:hypothetical protein